MSRLPKPMAQSSARGSKISCIPSCSISGIRSISKISASGPTPVQPPRPPAAPPPLKKQPFKKPSKTAMSAKEFELPPLSILSKEPPRTRTELEKLRQKTIRRNKPEGEDPKKIREIIRSIKGEDITVQEFVGLVSPYTGDNGTVLRNVMADDLSAFRNMVRKIYDNMTRDVSDVLANEQLQLTEFYKERCAQLSDRMERALDEVLAHAPKFDFNLYFEDPNYLEKMFPLAKRPEEESNEAYEMQKRQEAYHRLQWLRSEGERLNEENVRLQARLNELKKEQREELKKNQMREEQAERQKAELEEMQEDMKAKLDNLNRSLEESIVDHEKQIVVEPLPSVTELDVKKVKSKGRVCAARPKWNVRAAKEIETRAKEENLQSEVSRVSMRPSKTSLTRKSRSRMKMQQQSRRDPSPFHYSPPRDMPPPQPRQTSPFHYSPPRTPPEIRISPPSSYCPCPSTSQQSPSTSQRSPSTLQQTYQSSREAMPPPPQQTTTAMESSTTTVRRGRRCLAPRDTWGGFI